MEEFGKLTFKSPREIWPSESRDFTPWLADNIGLLGESLGMELELVEREVGVGSFSVDLLAKDLGTRRNVVIENQFGSTDHDHMGKLLTYGAGLDASTIIWVAETIRDEHRLTLEWLNQHTDDDIQFFGITVEIFQIDDSKPAFSFKLVVFPNEWQRDTSPSSIAKLTPREEAYKNFFQVVIDELRQKHHFTGAKVGQPQSWYSFSSGCSGITYALSFAMGDKVRVELYIDVGDQDKNKELFDHLFRKKESIESEIGQELSWERLG